MKAACAILAAAFAVGSSSAWSSEAFRCGGHIISDGDKKVKVLEHCGEPTERDDNHWVYDRGPEKLMVIVHFDQDVVSLIEELPKD